MISDARSCPICNRQLPEKGVSHHHLIPREIKLSKRRSKEVNRRETISIHPVCHKKIHSQFTNRELANKYNTVEKIINQPSIKKFVEWVSKKPIDFDTVSREGSNKKKINK